MKLMQIDRRLSDDYTISCHFNQVRIPLYAFSYDRTGLDQHV